MCDPWQGGGIEGSLAGQVLLLMATMMDDAFQWIAGACAVLDGQPRLPPHAALPSSTGSKSPHIGIVFFFFLRGHIGIVDNVFGSPGDLIWACLLVSSFME